MISFGLGTCVAFNWLLTLWVEQPKKKSPHQTSTIWILQLEFVSLRNVHEFYRWITFRTASSTALEMYLLQWRQVSGSLWTSGSTSAGHKQLRLVSCWSAQFWHSRLLWCHCSLLRVPHCTHIRQFYKRRTVIRSTALHKVTGTAPMWKFKAEVGIRMIEFLCFNEHGKIYLKECL